MKRLLRSKISAIVTLVALFSIILVLIFLGIAFSTGLLDQSGAYSTIYEDEQILIEERKVDSREEGGFYYPLLEEGRDLTQYQGSDSLKDCRGQESTATVCSQEYRIGESAVRIEFGREDTTPYYDLVTIYRDEQPIWVKKFSFTSYAPFSDAKVLTIKDQALVFDYQGATYSSNEINGGAYASANSMVIVDANSVIDVADSSDVTFAFEPFLFGDTLLYFVDNDIDSYLIWDGAEILVNRYDQISNARCCEPSAWKVVGENNVGVEFFAVDNGQLFQVKISAK